MHATNRSSRSDATSSSMRKLLVCQHVAHEILGTLDPLFRDAGFRIRYVNFGRHPNAQPSLEGYRGLVVLGGPMNVDEEDRYPHLTTELRLIEQAIESGIPVLGICLGAQLIAKTLGARVGRSPQKEIGWYDVSPTAEARQDPLFMPFEDSEKVFQWHGDAFEMAAGATRLAASAGCPNQAFRYGDKVYGFQFHLEVDEPMIERWMKIPSMRREVEEMAGSDRIDEILAATHCYIKRLKQLSDATFGEFVKLFNLPPKRKLLPSR